MPTLGLSRKVGEKILIGDDIEVQVAGVNRGKVWLRVTAPREVQVDREEVRRDREGAAHAPDGA